jgi:CubicO group peptidase (beta-lactamase class C family)
MRNHHVLILAALSISLLALHAQERTSVSDSAAKADTYLREEMAKRRIPGMSAAVITAGRVVFTKGYGFANVEVSAPATSDTVYEIASLTKPFTAIAVMMLVEAGRVSLEDPIFRYLPNVPSHWGDITVRHLSPTLLASRTTSRFRGCVPHLAACGKSSTHRRTF